MFCLLIRLSRNPIVDTYEPVRLVWNNLLRYRCCKRDQVHRALSWASTNGNISRLFASVIDTREMPPNGNKYVSALCVRGVRKVTLSEWREYAYKLKPDIAFALSDTCEKGIESDGRRFIN
ncbi:hypothetical protein EV401DRAFT_271472 [Pisolithus croceorrhizus]|nr:hypothetical protein EV401DRAFT_271472 [Pisolithus croceorrhizus]